MFYLGWEALSGMVYVTSIIVVMEIKVVLRILFYDSW
jgi:hypothetical protein